MASIVLNARKENESDLIAIGLDAFENVGGLKSVVARTWSELNESVGRIETVVSDLALNGILEYEN